MLRRCKQGDQEASSPGNVSAPILINWYQRRQAAVAFKAAKTEGSSKKFSKIECSQVASGALSASICDAQML